MKARVVRRLTLGVAQIALSFINLSARKRNKLRGQFQMIASPIRVVHRAPLLSAEDLDEAQNSHRACVASPSPRQALVNLRFQQRWRNISLRLTRLHRRRFLWRKIKIVLIQITTRLTLILASRRRSKRAQAAQATIGSNTRGRLATLRRRALRQASLACRSNLIKAAPRRP